MIKLLKFYLAFIAFFITSSHYAQNVSSIILSNGKNLEELNQSYSFRKTYYPNDTDTTLTVEFDSGSASYSINGTTGGLTSGEATASIPLPKGESELNIVYTSDTGDETTYTVYLIRPIPITNIIVEGSTDPNIANYEAGDYVAVLTPTFDQTIDSYEITVPHNVVKARVIWTVDDTGAQNVTGYNTHVGWLNGDKLESPTNTFTSIWGNINVGRTQWGPQYTTQTSHGSAGTDHIMTYITREGALTSSTISSINLSSGQNLQSINELYKFKKSFNYLDTETTLTVEFDSGSASYSINGTTGGLTSGEATASIPLPKGESELNIVYTSDTGDETTYTVYLIRPIPITNIIVEGSTDPNIANYEAGDYVAVLTPTFDQTIDSYEITVPHNVVKARVIWTVDDTGAQNVTGYNTHVGWLNGDKLESPTNTFTSIWGNINVGRTQWGPQYTTQTSHGSAGTDHIMTYITREGALTSSTISSINLSSGQNLQSINELYKFKKSFNYLDTETTLTVEFDSGSASYSINGTTGGLTSGEATASIPLPKGESELNIIYTSDTGDEITYTVYLIRPIPITNIIVEGSTDPNIANYEAGDYVAVLTPTFDQTIDSYEITVPHNVVKARVIWTVDDTGAQNVTGYNTHVGWLDGDKLESPTNTFTSIWGNINVGRTQWGPQYTTQTSHGSAGTDHIMTNITRKSSLEGPGITNINFSADENGNVSISFSSDLVLGSSTNDLKIVITSPDGSQIILTRDDFQFNANNMIYTLISALNLSSPGSYSLSIVNALDVYGVDGGNAGSGEQLDISIDIANDTVPPVITVLSGLEEWILGQNYSDAGATALDDVDGDITDQIVTDLSGLPNNGTPLDQIGVFQVVYTVSDAAGNQASNTREITVLDVTVPVVELIGDPVIYLEVFSDYIEPGYNATDDYDTNLTITVDGTIDTNTLGGYTLTYTATDQSGNVSNPVYRTVVIRDTTVPVITLIGDAEVSLVKGNTYTDTGATASDNYDGDVTANIVRDISNVNTNEVGSYTVTFNVSDSSGNAADQVTRTVIVKAPIVEPSVTIDNNTPGALATYTFKYATHYEIGSGSNSNIFYLSMPNSFPNFTTLVADGDLLDPYVTVKVNDVVYLCSDILGDVGGIWSSGIQLSVAGATTGIVIPADAIIEIAISGIIYNPSDYTTETLTWKTAIGSGAAIEQYSASITLETLSVNDKDAAANIISVYPNPTSDFWTVASQKIIKSIEIYDIHGKLMMSTKPQLKTTKIETKLFERGMYFARINGSKTVQLIKH